MQYVNVVVPGPWWNELTYISDKKISTGARVRVPIRGGVRIGFAVGQSNESSIECKKIIEVLDASCVFGRELWTLSRRLGSSFLCGHGETLKIISPTPFLKGETVDQISPFLSSPKQNTEFLESHCYFPIDGERYNFYIEKLLSCSGSALALFPERVAAENFFAALPGDLKNESLLWTGETARGKKCWQNWLLARGGNFKIIIGSIAAAYVPLPNLSLVIVDDEANPAYIPRRNPKIHARSAAGQRALLSRAELVLGGRMPSAKTFMRGKLSCADKPDKKSLHFIDIKKGFEAAVQGVEGTLPLSKTLVAETQKCISGGENALWIFDRKGYAVDIICDICGWGAVCEKCGAVLAVESNAALKCFRCGAVHQMPESCPACRGELFVGKRPGVEALGEIAKTIKGTGKLFVGTRKILSMCDKKGNIGLVGWIDIDSETRKPDYKSRFSAFSMVWESYWRGRDATQPRKIVIQSRDSFFHENFKSGWEGFWNRELQERRALEFPPCEQLVEIETKSDEIAQLSANLISGGHMVMQPRENAVWVSGSSLSSLENFLSPRFSITKSRLGFPCVTIFVE